MAKKLLVSIVAFVLCVTVLATEMVVKQKNGENWRINVNEVEEIIFDESIPEDSAIVDTSVTPLKFKILSDSTVEVINDDSYREDAFPESITIPAKVRIEGKTYNVISIGDHAFRDCNGLISIKIPNSVSSIGKGAFSYCQSLTSINIPEGVTSIGSSAFGYCIGLTSINIPKSLTFIGYSAFASCRSLTNVNIPESVTTIEEGAFRDCNKLDPKLLVYDKGTKCHGWIGDITKCIAIEIPEGVTSIDYRAFSNCSNLISISIPKSVTSIENFAFYKCSSLISVKIPERVTSIGNYAFSNCSNLDVTIDNSKDNITLGYGVFNLCKSVTYLK
jgi:hypothetical protein